MENKPKESKEQSFKTPKGMRDLLFEEAALFDAIFKSGRSVAEFFNFKKIETPILEEAELFIRSSGKTSDIVEKQMFILKTRGDDMLALRPEGTAPIVRSYLENGMRNLSQPVKLFYYGPMFRHEQPQFGRFRQFYQFGLEIIGGESESIYDAEIIIATYRALEELKIKNLEVQVNSIGCRTCQPKYRKRLVDYYEKEIKSICEDCKRRLKENPLRLLDCKERGCEETKSMAPSLMDSICAGCSEHFKGVLEFLDESAIPYVLNNRLVRGLDYYNKTVFEIFTNAEKESAIPKNKTGERAFNFALAAGGRYDYLVEMVGGRPTSAVGAAIGVDRTAEVIKSLEIKYGPKQKQKVFLIHVGEDARRKSLKLMESFRSSGIGISEALGKDSLGAQLKVADKEGHRFALIFGHKEVYEESIIIRDLHTGVQESIPLEKIIEEIKRRA